MSMLQEYRKIEETIRELSDRLKSLSKDDKLQKEIEFEEKLNKLMTQYDKKPSDVVAIIAPETKAAASDKAAKTGTKRPRRVKRYTNPNNGEVIETKGGNHKVLKAWKQQYGSETVESWAIVLD